MIGHRLANKDAGLHIAVEIDEAGKRHAINCRHAFAGGGTIITNSTFSGWLMRSGGRRQHFSATELLPAQRRPEARLGKR
jgi:hypothetical protein